LTKNPQSNGLRQPGFSIHMKINWDYHPLYMCIYIYTLYIYMYIFFCRSYSMMILSSQ
jgi:hypothetical protein